MDLIEYGAQFVGVQETTGSNRGPLVDKWKAEVSLGLHDLPIAWCACYVFAMLCEFNKLDKRGLAKALGFDAASWYPESTRSWHQQASRANRRTSTPKRGDVFLWLVGDGKGGFVADHPHHTGFYADHRALASSNPFATLEGNTSPGAGTGPASREGTGTFARARHWSPGEFEFIDIPQTLITHQEIP